MRDEAIRGARRSVLRTGPRIASYPHLGGVEERSDERVGIKNHAGERIIKRGVHGETSYVNQFWTVRNRTAATKHIFAGSSRIASKLTPGDADPDPDPDPTTGDPYANVLGQWYYHRSQSGFDHGQNTKHNPHYTGTGYHLPNHLAEDNFIFFYHPDHLGSTSYVTDRDGELYEYVAYFPYGETWYQQASNSEDIPYLFTGKELDEETGLYNFGARYYDPKTSVWQSADPLFSGDPGLAIHSPRNRALYSYGGGSPLVVKDVDGRWLWVPIAAAIAVSVFWSEPGNTPMRAEERTFDRTPEPIRAAVPAFSFVATAGGTPATVVLTGAGLLQVGTTVESSDDPDIVDAPLEIVGPLSVRGFRPRQLGPTNTIPEEVLQNLADESQLLPKRPSAAAVFQAKSGERFPGVSGTRKPPHPQVKEALDSMPQNKRAKWHGNCAEPQCISRALEAGVDPRGGTMRAVKVRSRGIVGHGTPLEPCNTCKELKRIFQIE